MVHLPDSPTLRNVPWPIGAEVPVYPRISDQMLPDMPPTGVSAVAVGMVQETQILQFGDLPYGEYWACAPLTPGMRDFQYVGFGVVAPPPEWIPGPTGPQGIQGPVGPAGPVGPQGVQGTQPQVPTAWVDLSSPVGQAVNVGANQNMIVKFTAGAAAYTIQGGGTLLVVTNAGIYAVTSWVRSGNGGAVCRHTMVFGTTAGIAGNPETQGVKGIADGSNRVSSTSAVVRPLSAGSAINIVAISDVLPMVGGITIAKVGDYVP